MARIQNILCPVDFFPASNCAAAYAIALAMQYGARLTLLHVVEPVVPWAYEFPFDTSALIRVITQRSNQELKKVVRRAEAVGVPADTVVLTGQVDFAIESIVEKHKIDFVVMGTHGRRGVEKFVMGSATERLLRKLHVPMLTIRNVKSKFEPSAIRHILVTTDFREGTRDAIGYAFSIAGLCHAKVTLLHVLNDVEADFSGRYRDPLIRSIRRELDDLVPNRFRHSSAVTVRVETGRPIRRILSLLKKEKIDLIVMNIHGKTLLDRMMIGSTAEKVVRGATMPVLVIPPMVAARRKRRTPGKAA